VRLDEGLKVTRLGSVVPWGLWVAFYIYFIGLSAGSFLLSTLVFVFGNKRLEPVGRLAVLQAFVCLLTGLVFIFIDLGHWQRFWHVLAYPQWHSVLAWEIWFYNVYILLLLSEMWLLMRADLARLARTSQGVLGWVYGVLSLGFRPSASDADEALYEKRARKWLHILGLIGIPIALGVHGGTGAIFAVVKARPAWYSPIFPVVFVVSALASGGGLLLFLRAFVAPQPEQDKKILPFLARLTGGFLLLDIMLLFLEFLTGFYGGIPDHVAVYSLITRGPFWWVFWFGQILLGAIVPLVLIYGFRRKGASRWRLGLAGLCVAVGIFGVRLNIVIPAMAVPVVAGFDHAIDSPRLSSLYTPNWVEWLTSLGIVAGAALLSYGAIRILPVQESIRRSDSQGAISTTEGAVEGAAAPEHSPDRRRFLRNAGLGITATAGGAGLVLTARHLGSGEHALPSDPEKQAQWGRTAGVWIPSCCNMCGGQSGILVHVVDGVVEKIEPNHWNPVNYTNISEDFFDGYTVERGCKEGGAICAKGNAGIMQLYDPDRLKRPLKRGNPDKSPGADPRWQEISWQQALDEIAAKLRVLREAGEAHKLLWMSEDHSFTHIQQDFCTLFGTPNYSMHSNLCDVARKASFRCVVGDERPLADFLQSRYILLFGWNPTSAIKWIYLPRILTRAVERGARLVVVDPYLSDTAVKAHEWVRLRPGTDGALALALAHVLIREQLYDVDFVRSWTVGFEQFAAYVQDKTPEWAAEITTVPASTIRRLAHELATMRPVCIDFWSGPGQHSNGVQAGRAIAALAALLGGYDQPGTLLLPDHRGNKHVAVEPDAVAAQTLRQPRFDQLQDYPLGHKSGVYCQMFTNLAEGRGPYQPKMLVCIFQNPMMSVPGSQTVAQALSRLETVVVIDTMMSETAALADYVLPGTVYLERYDLNTHWVSWPCVGLRQPVVKPLFGQPAEYEVITALGRQLDLRDAAGRPFFRIGPLSGQPIEDLTAWYEDYLSCELKQGAPGITLEELKALPGAVWYDRRGTRYRKYEESIPADQLKTAWFAGDPQAEGTAIYDRPPQQGGKRIGTVIAGHPVRGFFTPSGKVEIVSPWLANVRDAEGHPVDVLPVYVPRHWQPTGDYPLFLINWKEASHTHTRTQNNPWLLDIQPSNPLIIHPETAAQYGIQDGDYVWIESPYGRVLGRAKLSRRIHPEVVGLQHGFGHTALGRQARGRGTSDAWLRPTKADGLSGQALHKETCVRLVKASSIPVQHQPISSHS